MEQFIPIAIALVCAVIAWKVFKGMVKIASIVVLFAVAGALYWQGVI